MKVNKSSLESILSEARLNMRRIAEIDPAVLLYQAMMTADLRSRLVTALEEADGELSDTVRQSFDDEAGKVSGSQSSLAMLGGRIRAWEANIAAAGDDPDADDVSSVEEAIQAVQQYASEAAIGHVWQHALAESGMTSEQLIDEAIDYLFGREVTSEEVDAINSHISKQVSEQGAHNVH